MMINSLYLGDSISVMKEIPEHTVDLIYLDPPFFSNRVHESNSNKSNRLTFEDLWNGGMDDYLDFMNEILIKSHNLLSNTGSLFLHCDWHAVHYLKVELDKIFGYGNFRNEIIWKRHNSQNNGKQGAKIFGRMHDTILVYSKSSKYIWNQPYSKYSDGYLKRAYTRKDENGMYALGDLTGPGGSSKGNPYFEFLGFKRYWRYNKEKMEKLFKEGKIIQLKPNTLPKLKRYLKDMKGVPLSDLWIDIPTEQTTHRKSVLYPTQKPENLLNRIISCSSNPGDLVLDPFCGSGTTIICANKLKRKWIGIDKNPQSIGITRERLLQCGVTGTDYVLKSEISHLNAHR